MAETPAKLSAHPRLPVLFVGHGSPMNVIEDNAWSRGFKSLASLFPKPKAILAVSAHWYLAGTLATSNEKPETIHDFGGFPDPLYKVQYPAPGSPDLARRAVALLGRERAALNAGWGLDHGTWSVLVHMRPAADLPVVQVSIDGRLKPEDHLALGRALAPLREEGVLILASGNVTHNLAHAFNAMRRGDTATPPWARRFDEATLKALQERDAAALVAAPATEDGRLAHPTPDHYLPLLYAFGASDAADRVQFPITGFDLASLSMRSVLFG
jgi:4,5-DOPA dioxygenase extradiol